jgi:hypothetical protein
MNLTSAAAALDERRRVLMCEVRSDGRSEPSIPVVFEDMVHELPALDREYGAHLIRLWHGARRDRLAIGEACMSCSTLERCR